jgi:hypothetical protein
VKSLEFLNKIFSEEASLEFVLLKKGLIENELDLKKNKKKLLYKVKKY